MKRYRIDFADDAKLDLLNTRNYFTERFGEEAADRFIQEILADCEDLSLAPLRGTRKQNAPEGFRQIGAAKGRVTLMFHVGLEDVVILAVHYRGRQH